MNITGGTITENVFGGGKGEADEFSCSKAMVGVNNAGAGADLTTEENKNKGTKVTISNGELYLEEVHLLLMVVYSVLVLVLRHMATQLWFVVIVMSLFRAMPR